MIFAQTLVIAYWIALIAIHTINHGKPKVLASDVPMLCSCLVNKIYRLSIAGRGNEEPK